MEIVDLGELRNTFEILCENADITGECKTLASGEITQLAIEVGKLRSEVQLLRSRITELEQEE